MSDALRPFLFDAATDVAGLPLILFNGNQSALLYVDGGIVRLNEEVCPAPPWSSVFQAQKPILLGYSQAGSNDRAQQPGAESYQNDLF